MISVERELPKISILLLTYNSSEFIAETLRSIFIQNYPYIEIVIGDDASEDGTQDIIDSLEREAPSAINFIKHYAKNNAGITCNFNNCLASCSGEFVFLQGGDDVFLPGKLRAQVLFMLARPDVVISYHDVEVFDSATNEVLYLYNKDRHGFFSGNSKVLVRQGTFNCGCSTAVRNKNLPNCDSRIRYASDWLWYLNILALTNGKIDYFPGVYARYRRHSGNITSKSALHRQVDEVLITLDAAADFKGTIARDIRVARAERLFVYSMKALLSRDISNSIRWLFLSFRPPYFGVYYAFKRFLFKKV